MMIIGLYIIFSIFIATFLVFIESLLLFYLFPLLIISYYERKDIFYWGWVILLVTSLVLDFAFNRAIGTYGVMLGLTYSLVYLINSLTLVSSVVMKLSSYLVLYVSYSLVFFLVKNSFSFELLFDQNINFYTSILLRGLLFIGLYFLISYFTDSSRYDNKLKVGK